MGLTAAEQAIYDELRAKADDGAGEEVAAVAAVVAVEAAGDVAQLEAKVEQLEAAIVEDAHTEQLEAVAEAAAEQAAAETLPEAAAIAEAVAEVTVAELLEAVVEASEAEQLEAPAETFELPAPVEISDEAPEDTHWLYRPLKFGRRG